MHLAYQLAGWPNGCIVSYAGARDFHSGLQAGMLCFLRGVHTVAGVSRYSPYLQGFCAGTPQQQSWLPNCSEISSGLSWRGLWCCSAAQKVPSEELSSTNISSPKPPVAD